jgi:hypothetical protein
MGVFIFTVQVIVTFIMVCMMLRKEVVNLVYVYGKKHHGGKHHRQQAFYVMTLFHQAVKIITFSQ